MTLNGTLAGIEANETSGERRPWPNGQNLHPFSPSVHRKNEGEEQRSIVLESTATRDRILALEKPEEVR